MAHLEKNILCEYCDYKTNKRYNLTRHMEIKHPCCKDTIFCCKDTPICCKDTPNLLKRYHTIAHDNQCEKCEKILSSKRNYLNHIEKCKGKINKLQCQYCQEIFKCAPHKYRHQKNCKIKHENKNQLITTNEQSQPLTQNIEMQQNINTQNNTQNVTINVLKFPEEGEDFEFLSDHIDMNAFKKIWDKRNPEIGFSKFTHAILDRPENRIIRKNNVYNKYSSIHQGDNNWELALDKNVYPVLMHQMTCTALEQSHEYKKKKLSLACTDLGRIIEYLQDINTENDDIENRFTEAIENLQLIVCNMTKKWEKENQDNKIISA